MTSAAPCPVRKTNFVRKATGAATPAESRSSAHPIIVTCRSSSRARLLRHFGLFVQVDVYGILLQELVACAAQSLSERGLAEP